MLGLPARSARHQAPRILPACRASCDPRLRGPAPWPQTRARIDNVIDAINKKAKQELPFQVCRPACTFGRHSPWAQFGDPGTSAGAGTAWAHAACGCSGSPPQGGQAQDAAAPNGARSRCCRGRGRPPCTSCRVGVHLPARVRRVGVHPTAPAARLQVIMSTQTGGDNHKPRTGMWDFLVANANKGVAPDLRSVPCRHARNALAACEAGRQSSGGGQGLEERQAGGCQPGAAAPGSCSMSCLVAEPAVVG